MLSLRDTYFNFLNIYKDFVQYCLCNYIIDIYNLIFKYIITIQNEQVSGSNHTTFYDIIIHLQRWNNRSNILAILLFNSELRWGYRSSNVSLICQNLTIQPHWKMVLERGALLTELQNFASFWSLQTLDIQKASESSTCARIPRYHSRVCLLLGPQGQILSKMITTCLPFNDLLKYIFLSRGFTHCCFLNIFYLKGLFWTKLFQKKF